MAVSKVQLVGGPFLDTAGNPIANGKLILELQNDEQLSSSTGQVGCGIKTTILLDSNGNVQGTSGDGDPAQYVWPTDAMVPINASYAGWVYSAEGQLVWGPNYNLLVPSGATFNVDLWVPSSANAITPNNSENSITLETNGVVNASQSVENLIAGSNITLTADGAGGTTIAAGSLSQLVLVADGTTDNYATIAAAIAALPSTGGTINLVAGTPSGDGTCYVSQAITISSSTKGVVLRGSGWSGNLGNPVANLTLKFAANQAGIIVNGAESCIVENMLLLSMDTGAVSGDNGLWFKGLSGTPTIRNVGAKSFGGHGFLLDSTSGGNIDGWRIDQIYSYENFGDGLRMQGGSDTSVGVLTGATIQKNAGWGINIDSGSGASSYINPNLAGNVTGGVRVNSSNNKFLGCYIENDSTPSNFVVEAGIGSTTAYFTAFGQPAVITNLGGASNVIWYHDVNGLQGFANVVITNEAYGAGPGVRSYTLMNGAFNPNDFTIEDDLGHTWFDINQSLSAVLFPQDVYFYELTGATSSGGVSSPTTHWLSQFWNPSADSGTVNTSGTAVTWVSGTVFNSGMVGGTIVINGSPYTVATYVDNHHITISTSAGTQTGVSYTFGISEADNWDVQAVAGSGSNGSSTLKFTHSGTTGVSTIELGSPLVLDAATPTVGASQVGLGTTTGFGNGTPATAMTTTTKGTGSGPANPQTVVSYLKVNVGGTDFWMPLVQ